MLDAERTTTALAVGLGVSTWQWAAKSEAYRRVALSEQVEIKLRKEAYYAWQVAGIRSASSVNSRTRSAVGCR
jgi:hypothetical protein